MDQNNLDNLANTLWDYLKVGKKLVRSDVILVMGNSDIRCANRAVDLFLSGYAPLILFSGGLGRLTSDRWIKPEAEVFADQAYQRGVSRKFFIIENQSSNMLENILFSKKILSEKYGNLRRIIIVQKPYLERRAYATARKNWPEIKFTVTSPQTDFGSYPNELVSKDEVINGMTGEIQRLHKYYAKGFITFQSIPDDVQKACNELIRLGFTKQLVE